MDYQQLHDTALERSVLSALIWDLTTDFSIAADGLSPDCFSDNNNRMLFMALRSLADTGRSTHDYILIIDAMNRLPEQKGTFQVTDFVNMVTADPQRSTVSVNIPHYVAILVDLMRRRQVFEMLHEASGMIADMTVDCNETTSQLLKGITDTTRDSASRILPVQEIVRELKTTIADNLSGEGRKGIATGISRLDGYGGLHPSDLIIIAAGSSQGKTALATTMAMNIASHSPLAFYSMEMTPRQLIARMVARNTGVSANRLLFSRLTDEEQRRVEEAAPVFNALNDRVFIDDRSVMTVNGIMQSIRYLYARHGIRVAVIDYLQILGLNCVRGMMREQVVADAARQFKNLAKELGIAIILLSQINRDNSSGPVPSVARIRDSGEINEAADLTLLLYRPESGMAYPKPYQDIETAGTAMVIVAKDRNGGYGGLHNFFLGFNPELSHFYDLQQLPHRSAAAATTTPAQPW